MRERIQRRVVRDLMTNVKTSAQGMTKGKRTPYLEMKPATTAVIVEAERDIPQIHPVVSEN